MHPGIQILAELIGAGLKHFCVCAGSRNSQILKFLATQEKIKELRVFHFFDERSAGFFALGLAKGLGDAQKISSRVVVVTTSGTAVAELLPSAIEAYYSGVSLVFCSADREKKFRVTGAPQCIDQTQVFGTYVDKFFDLYEDMPGIDGVLSQIQESKSVHLNLCYSDRALLETQVKSFEIKENVLPWVEPVSVNLENEKNKFDKFLSLQKPSETLIIAGSLPAWIPDETLHHIKRFLVKSKSPLWVESTSQLRKFADLKPQRLISLEREYEAFNFRSVLRLGGVPTTRYWRDLENLETRNLSISPYPFSGHPNSDLIVLGLEYWPQFFSSQESKLEAGESYTASSILSMQERVQKKISNLIAAFPDSEPSLVRKVSEAIPSQDLVFLGNSLPIREWDFFSVDKEFKIVANRGANGIDGEISSFLGNAASSLRKNSRAHALVGDLTALYDLNAYWGHDKITNPFEVIILNNGGGKIFSRVKSLKNLSEDLSKRFFELNHALRFDGIAKTWGLDYWVVDSHKALDQIANGPQSFGQFMSSRVVEILPDWNQTQKFWQAYEEIFKEKIE